MARGTKRFHFGQFSKSRLTSRTSCKGVWIVVVVLVGRWVWGLGIGETTSVFVEDDLGGDIGEDISLSRVRLFIPGILVFILDFDVRKAGSINVDSVAISRKIIVKVTARCCASEKHYV